LRRRRLLILVIGVDELIDFVESANRPTERSRLLRDAALVSR